MQRTNEAVIQIFQVQPGEEHADRQTLHFLHESPKDVILFRLEVFIGRSSVVVTTSLCHAYRASPDYSVYSPEFAQGITCRGQQVTTFICVLPEGLTDIKTHFMASGRGMEPRLFLSKLQK